MNAKKHHKLTMGVGNMVLHTTQATPRLAKPQLATPVKTKKRKTVSVTYKPGKYKEGEEIKAIRALNEMHKGIKAKKHRKHKKNWIAGAIKHPGALHRQLGIKQGRKIPAKTLARAASKGGKLGRRARLAQTLKHLHK